MRANRRGQFSRGREGPIWSPMSIRPWRDIDRRKSRQIMVGSVPVGGDAPISVQTMTNTLTSDAKATIDQIRRCEDAGVDIIRVSCPDRDSTAALKEIVRAASVPIVARSEEPRLNSSHMSISYAVFCLKKKKIGIATSELQSNQQLVGRLVPHRKKEEQ